MAVRLLTGRYARNRESGTVQVAVTKFSDRVLCENWLADQRGPGSLQIVITMTCI